MSSTGCLLSQVWRWGVALEQEVSISQITAYAQEGNRPSVLAGQVNHGITSYLALGQVAEARNIIESRQVYLIGIIIVTLGIEIHDVVVPVAGGKHEGVSAGATVKQVIALAAVQDVVVRAAVQGVIIRVTVQGVFAGIAEQFVVAGTAVDYITPAVARQGVVAAGAIAGRAVEDEVVVGQGSLQCLKVFQFDLATAVCIGQINFGVSPWSYVVLQVLYRGNVPERRQVNLVFPLHEVRDVVIAMSAGKLENISAAVAGQPVIVAAAR